MIDSYFTLVLRIENDKKGENGREDDDNDNAFSSGLTSKEVQVETRKRKQVNKDDRGQPIRTIDGSSLESSVRQSLIFGRFL